MFEPVLAVTAELQRELARVRGVGSSVPSAEWVALVGACQEAMNVLTAVQSVALARVAATEEVVREDGTVEEEYRGLGHERLDAPALVADALGLTASGATGRVAGAVDLVTRHPGLLRAMGAGRLDGYRAAVVATELGQADAEVCAEVVQRLDGWLGREAGGALRRRTRRLLAVVDADLVRSGAVRARGERSLRRGAFGPGVDEWCATLPVERSRVAWSVVDGLARRYVADGSCAGLEQARADALLDLILSRATGTVDVNLTVPASVMSRAAEQAGREAAQQSQAARGTGGEAERRRPSEAGDHLVPVTGFGMPGVTQVRASWLAGVVRDAAAADGSRVGDAESAVRAVGRSAGAVTVVACDDRTGALAALPVPVGALVASGPPQRGSDGAVRGRAERTAAGRSAFVAAAVRGEPTAYRPPPWLVEFVKARDGRCRFPGCAVSARFCDVDHVVAWPGGVTHPFNLVCLCRRHHRVKQRPRWRVRLDPDGTLVWTDPCGRQRSTLPEDHLGVAANELLGDRQRLTAPDHAAPACPQVPAPEQEPGPQPEQVAAGEPLSAPVPARQPVPVLSVLEDELLVEADRHLVDLACHPDLLTAHNRRALRRGGRVSTSTITALVRSCDGRPDLAYPARRYLVNPSLAASHRGERSRDHSPTGHSPTGQSPTGQSPRVRTLRGHLLRDRRIRPRPSPDDPPPF